MFNNIEQNIPIRTGGHAIIYPVNKDPHVLLLQRNGGSLGGLWECPGGSVERTNVLPTEPQDDYLNILKQEQIRELKEETGFQFSPEIVNYFPPRYQFLTNNQTGIVLNSKDISRRFIPLYTWFNSGIGNKAPKVIISDEHQGCQWVSLEGNVINNNGEFSYKRDKSSIGLPLTQITGIILNSLISNYHSDDQASAPGTSRFSEEFFPNGFVIMH